MTNNLNTIEGAQQEVIDQLEYNLQAKGVLDAQFNPTTGLLGLINRIPDIEPSTNINLDISLTINSAEPSVDYGGSILLSATLMASYEGASDVDLKTGEITGATITFKKGGTIIGTSITDNNGVATLLYTPVAADCDTALNLSAVFSGTDNFNSANSNNINVDVNSTLELTSDKDILSYADNEYATLTATLNSADKNNKEIIFEVRKQSDDSLVETLTGNTDSSGNATVYYYGQGAGDIYIKTKCMNLIQTFVVLDCSDYQPLTSNAHQSRWTILSGMSVSYDANGMYCSASQFKDAYCNTEMTTPCSMEFTLVDYTPQTNVPTPLMYIWDSNNTRTVSMSQQNGVITYGIYGGTTHTFSHSFVKGAIYRLDFLTNKVEFYENDVLLFDLEYTTSLPLKFGFAVAQNRPFKIKDLKLKPL